MKKKPMLAMVALTATASMLLAACGGGGTSSNNNSGGGGSGATAAFNAAVERVYNPSDKKGGTLKMAKAGDWGDSVDTGDTYYAYSWNFLRLYARTLMMFKSGPGAQGAELVPDLAEAKGTPSADLKTWTYKIRKGVKFEDGTPVTSKDVKYAVARSLDKEVLPNGPTYFNDYLDLGDFKSPYKQDPSTLKAIETPDDQTIVFKLKSPLSNFDYFVMQPATAPVPQAKDTGTKYKEHVISTGPYKFSKYELGKSMTLVRNDQWDASTDPNRKALPDQIDVTLNANPEDLDNQLLAGTIDLDIEGNGVRAAAQAKILNDPTQKANADSTILARNWFTSINGDVAPLDNVNCRKAIEYAADRTGYQRAYGGADTGGEIATGLLPPVIPGYEKFDLYPSEGNKGDQAKAKEALTACGQPNGFETNISYRAERPKEKATAESLKDSLGKVGINLTIKPLPESDYTKLYAGKPDYAKDNKLGLMVYGWGADWPDGFGFLANIVDSRTIRATGGNSNLSVKDPEVDKLVDKAIDTTDEAARNKIWAEIDKKVMSDAFILPGVWAKGLLYRPKTLTNVMVSNGFQQYDYLALGVNK
ncbi:peptide/nickel transport system substrate-binding protein [Kibdelosporangium banguiense]|uniref:Peptide/nickel transport system substrate-binding protein n=1 Tax=Kibdelosporangium banguiense TaxID=1365924 RepID=A0ABS4TC11_9PSEU|nr:ABC transporter substrate-binding protein [Kibdelosporangium banguiense]MBP2321519.1 peptide/nickel transport system substrate-binding protein [Kibdelosporangium banguiense]